MQTPEDRPSLPAGAWTATGPPITFSASAGVTILHTSIFLPDALPPPLLVADVPEVPPDFEPELLPQPARTTSATAAAAPIRAFGRMTMSSPGRVLAPITVCGAGSRIGDRCHTARREGTDDGPRA